VLALVGSGAAAHVGLVVSELAVLIATHVASVARVRLDLLSLGHA
jgi:hypothetical protein